MTRGQRQQRRHTRQPERVLLVAAAVFCVHGGAAAKDKPPPHEAAPRFAEHVSFSALGGVGLINTGNARFMGDGEVALGASYAAPFGNLFMTWQATPWLEATARYGDIRHEPDALDRALDLKIRLVKEGDFLPAVALGFRDILGSGPFSGEYLALTKRHGRFDVTFGLGWGALAARNSVTNPLTWISGAFDNRSHTQSGVPAYKNVFAGRRMGFFGGVEYMAPLDGLSLKLEFDSSDARTLPLALPIEKDFPLNIGADYRPFDWLHLSLGFVRGDTLSAGLAFRLNPGTLVGRKKHKDPKPLAVSALTARPAAAPPRPGTALAVPPVPAPTRPLGDTVPRVSRALLTAGITEPLFELDAEDAVLTASFPAETAARQTVQAAYIVFANLPASYNRLTVRNRLGDAVGAEGQLFTRDLVAEFARTDAAFDDLLRAGGVRGLTLDGQALHAVLGQTPASTDAAAALADLTPTVASVAVAGAPAQAAAPLRRERAEAQVISVLAERGLAVSNISWSGSEVTVAADMRQALSPDALQRSAEMARAILGDGDQSVRVTIEARRGERAVAATTAPEETSAPAKITRHLPLFGVVAWSTPDPATVRAADHALPLTTGEAADIFARAKAQGLEPVAAELTENSAVLAVANPRFRQPAQAIGRAARVLDFAAPPHVDWLEVVTVADGTEIARTRFLRDDFTKAVTHGGSPEEVWINTEIGRERGQFPEAKGWRQAERDWPLFRWALYPELLQHFGAGAEDGYRAEVYGTAEARVEFLNGFSLAAAFSRDIGGNLDRVRPRPEGAVPHVRSDIARYVEKGKNALTMARIDYTAQPFRDLYLRASAGMFERMYGGIGGEILFAPQASAFAVGVDVNWVKQRDFDQLASFRDYSATTGAVSLYHFSPALGLRTVLSAGRYLARDWGATLDISREFENGMRFGAWATVTNMSRAEFGSDSFAKGLYLTVPLDLVWWRSSRRDLPVAFRVLNRDGGQRLDKGPGLYDLVAPGSDAAIARSWRHLAD